VDRMIEKYEFDSENDIILIIGDININARNCWYDIDLFKDYKLFKNILPNLTIRDNKFNKYECLIKILEDNDKNTVIDHLYKTYNDHPVTIGESQIVDGIEIPLETVLTNNNDIF